MSKLYGLARSGKYHYTNVCTAPKCGRVVRVMSPIDKRLCKECARAGRKEGKAK